MLDLGPHQRIAIDSNVLIYLMDSHGPLADVAAAVIDAVEDGEVDGILSAIGLMEVLTGAGRGGDAAAFELAAETIRDLRLRVVSLRASIAEDAAWIRGATGHDLADAAHLATARASGATAFITNDRRIRSIPRLEVLYLDDLAA